MIAYIRPIAYFFSSNFTISPLKNSIKRLTCSSVDRISCLIGSCFIRIPYVGSALRSFIYTKNGYAHLDAKGVATLSPFEIRRLSLDKLQVVRLQYFNKRQCNALSFNQADFLYQSGRLAPILQKLKGKLLYHFFEQYSQQIASQIDLLKPKQVALWLRKLNRRLQASHPVSSTAYQLFNCLKSKHWQAIWRQNQVPLNGREKALFLRHITLIDEDTVFIQHLGDDQLQALVEGSALHGCSESLVSRLSLKQIESLLCCYKERVHSVNSVAILKPWLQLLSLKQIQETLPFLSSTSTRSFFCYLLFASGRKEDLFSLATPHLISQLLKSSTFAAKDELAYDLLWRHKDIFAQLSAADRAVLSTRLAQKFAAKDIEERLCLLQIDEPDVLAALLREIPTYGQLDALEETWLLANDSLLLHCYRRQADLSLDVLLALLDKIIHRPSIDWRQFLKLDVSLTYRLLKKSLPLSNEALAFLLEGQEQSLGSLLDQELCELEMRSDPLRLNRIPFPLLALIPLLLKQRIETMTFSKLLKVAPHLNDEHAIYLAKRSLSNWERKVLLGKLMVNPKEDQVKLLQILLSAFSSRIEALKFLQEKAAGKKVAPPILGWLLVSQLDNSHDALMQQLDHYLRSHFSDHKGAYLQPVLKAALECNEEVSIGWFEAFLKKESLLMHVSLLELKTAIADYAARLSLKDRIRFAYAFLDLFNRQFNPQLIAEQLSFLKAQSGKRGEIGYDKQSEMAATLEDLQQRLKRIEPIVTIIEALDQGELNAEKEGSFSLFSFFNSKNEPLASCFSAFNQKLKSLASVQEEVALFLSNLASISDPSHEEEDIWVFLHKRGLRSQRDYQRKLELSHFEFQYIQQAGLETTADLQEKGIWKPGMSDEELFQSLKSYLQTVLYL